MKAVFFLGLFAGFFSLPFLLCPGQTAAGLKSAGLHSVSGQDVLRGEVVVELEPAEAAFIEDKYPLEKEDAYRRALEQAALFFSAQIYGWSFYYDIGERARGIAEEFELVPAGSILWGDPGLKVTDARFSNFKFEAWMDFRPRDFQARRVRAWKSGTIRTAQAVGFGSLGGPQGAAETSAEPDWFVIKRTALEDAARAAVRQMLRGSERNRPKEARGFVGLAGFPRYFMDSGRWACSARFYVDIKELVPFSAY